MFKTKDEATLALTLVKLYLQEEVTKQDDYAPSVLNMYLGLIDRAILYIEPNADINGLCKKVSEKNLER